MNMKKVDLANVMDVPKVFTAISVPKLSISKAIKEGMQEKEWTVRGLGEQIGMKHPQIVRVTSGENYNIDTLLKILDGLDLQLVVQKNTDR